MPKIASAAARLLSSVPHRFFFFVGVGRIALISLWWTWIVDLPIAGLMLWLTHRWGLVQSLRNRLLAMLHAGFLWYGTGFLLAGAHSLALLAGGRGMPLAGLHALAIGFAASLMMAMVTRVTCGHAPLPGSAPRRCPAARGSRSRRPCGRRRSCGVSSTRRCIGVRAPTVVPVERFRR